MSDNSLSTIKLTDCTIPSGGKLVNGRSAIITIPTAPGLVSNYRLTEDFLVHSVTLHVPIMDGGTLRATLYTHYSPVLNETYDVQSKEHILAQILVLHEPVYDVLIFSPSEVISQLLDAHVNQPVRAYLGDIHKEREVCPTVDQFRLDAYTEFSWPEYIDPDRSEFDSKLQAKLSSARNFAAKKRNMRLRDPAFISEAWEKYVEQHRVQYALDKADGKMKFDKVQIEVTKREHRAYEVAHKRWTEKQAETTEYNKKAKLALTVKHDELTNCIAKAVKVRRTECLL